MLDDVLLFLQTALQIGIRRADLAACHPLRPVKDVNNTVWVIIKFFYHHHKIKTSLDTWVTSQTLQNPRNRQLVYISQRLGKYDPDLKKHAENLGLFVTTSNSTPYLHFESNNCGYKMTALNDEKDLQDLKLKAVKKPIKSANHVSIKKTRNTVFNVQSSQTTATPNN